MSLVNSINSINLQLKKLPHILIRRIPITLHTFIVSAYHIWVVLIIATGIVFGLDIIFEIHHILAYHFFQKLELAF